MIKKIFRKYLKKNGKDELKAELEITKLRLQELQCRLLELKTNATKDEKKLSENESDGTNSLVTREDCHRFSEHEIDPECKFHQRIFLILDLINEFETEGKFVTAIVLCRKMIMILREIRCENHPEVLASKNKLLELKSKLVKSRKNKHENQIDEMKHTEQKAMIIRKCGVSVFSVPPHLRRIAELIDLAVQQKNFKRAELLCKKKLVILIRLHGRYHSDVAKVLDCLAVKIYLKQGKYIDALSIIDETIEIKKKIYGDNHLEIAFAYKYQSSALSALGRHEKVIASIKNAIRIEQQISGDNNYSIAIEYNNLAVHYFLDRKGNYNEIIELLNTSLSILQKQDMSTMSDQLILKIKQLIFHCKINLSIVYLEKLNPELLEKLMSKCFGLEYVHLGIFIVDY